MLSIKKLAGVHVNEALPVLAIDEAESKIARIPGWKLFITPHKAFLDPATKRITERVNGTQLVPASISGDTFALGTLPDGNPSFEMGMDSQSTPTAYTSSLFVDSGEITEFAVVRAYADLGTYERMYLFLREDGNTIDTGKVFIGLGLSPTAIHVTRETTGQARTSVITDTNHAAAYTAGKLVYIMATYSADQGYALYVDGVLAGTTVPDGAPLDPDTVLSIGYSNKLRCAIGAMGVLGIDLSKPINAGYRAALDAWVESKFTLGNA